MNGSFGSFGGILMPQVRITGWNFIAQEVNKYSSKPYYKNYIRDVAMGYRSNKQLFNLLTQLGIIAQIRAIKQGEVQ